jgi:hypothetical protein
MGKQVLMIDKNGNETSLESEMVRRKVLVTNDEPDVGAEQAHKEMSNINNIIAKYDRTGIIEHRKEFSGYYDDFTGQDFTDMQFQVAKAKSMFEELPASIRNRFEQSPAKFLDFVQNPANAKEITEMGLAKARLVENPDGTKQSIDQHYQAKGNPTTENTPAASTVDAPPPV